MNTNDTVYNSWVHIENIISWVVPFLLGLVASFIIDTIRNYRNNFKRKKFIKHYLKTSILPILPNLEIAYETIINIVSDYKPDFFEMPAFEDFNTNVLDGIEPIEYFKIFKEEYTLLNEIISMIGYLSKNLPYDINSRFTEYIINHLKVKGQLGNIKHAENCEICKGAQNATLTTLNNRIKEIKSLDKKINDLLKKT